MPRVGWNFTVFLHQSELIAVTGTSHIILKLFFRKKFKYIFYIVKNFVRFG